MQDDKGSESSTSTLPSGYIKIAIENGPFMIFMVDLAIKNKVDLPIAFCMFTIGKVRKFIY
jgi:hypothetical protein